MKNVIHLLKIMHIWPILNYVKNINYINASLKYCLLVFIFVYEKLGWKLKSGLF